jgi:hypothetical protein
MYFLTQIQQACFTICCHLSLSFVIFYLFWHLFLLFALSHPNCKIEKQKIKILEETPDKISQKIGKILD